MLHLNHVADRYGRKIPAVGFARSGVDAAGARRAAAAAKQIRADHKVPLGIYGPPGADHDIPPAGVVIGRMLCHVGIAADRVTYQNGIVPVLVELSVRFVRNGNLWERAAEFELKGVIERA